MKYAVLTFGCRVNQADSLGFEEGLLGRGAQAGPAEAADVVVVNTCSVMRASSAWPRNQSMKVRTPCWASCPTAARSRAGSAANQSRSASMRATALACRSADEACSRSTSARAMVLAGGQQVARAQPHRLGGGRVVHAAADEIGRASCRERV